jgi:predicted TIM-barrel fold metal-dependent hydrolase
MEETECAGLALTPREYFARQCVISSDPEDTLAPFVIGTVGADHVIWASDFPHPDAHFPDAVDVFLHGLDGVDPAARQAVLWDTPLRFYGLDSRFG